MRAGGRRAGIALAVGVLATPALAQAHGVHAAQMGDPLGRSTVEQTLTGDDPRSGFAFLRIGPGEPYAVRTDLLAARAGRATRRGSIAFFGQITDFQLVDEESPARVEFFDSDPSGSAAPAWRPQEALVAHQVEWTIRQLNRFVRSPIPQRDGRRARMTGAVMTGDLADNMQRNETEWVVGLLEGGAVHPNSGTTDLAGTACPPGTPLDDPEGYTGVQDYDDYALADESFYDPEQPLGRYADWPVYPGLLDRAQEPIEAEGLKVPSYVAFGNHDALVQGVEDANATFEDLATGCVKPLGAPSSPMLVPPDPKRQFVDKRQFKEIHDTGQQDDAHGFAYVDRAELHASEGAASYYSWSPKRGVRFVVLDTVSDAGIVAELGNGNIDDPQFWWLERELAAASGRDELIVVFGHHARTSLNARAPDEAAPPCVTDDEHGHDVNPGCDRDPRSSQPIHGGDDLEALLHRFPHVVAYVAGHSHETAIQPYRRPGGGYWEVKSPAVVDWPPQHRLLEVMDNCDDTLSIFATILDHGGPATAPPSGTRAEDLDLGELASIGRTLSYNDPQVGPGSGAQGTPIDRNAELLIDDPRTGADGVRGIRLRASRSRVRQGRRTRLRVRVTSASGEPVAGAVVRLAGRRAVTNRRGRATLTVRPRRVRVIRARARVPNACGPRASTSVRVVAAGSRRRSAPSFTG
jgi:metallophosphoesterase (TIGR03767 family)